MWPNIYIYGKQLQECELFMRGQLPIPTTLSILGFYANKSIKMCGVGLIIVDFNKLPFYLSYIYIYIYIGFNNLESRLEIRYRWGVVYPMLSLFNLFLNKLQLKV